MEIVVYDILFPLITQQMDCSSITHTLDGRGLKTQMDLENKSTLACIPKPSTNMDIQLVRRCIQRDLRQ